MGRETAVWFVMIGGQQQGPMSRADVGLKAATRAIDAETFVWKEGMSDWLPGAEVPELAQLFRSVAKPATPPPPPPAARKPKPEPAKKGGGDGPAGDGRSAKARSIGGMPTFDTSHFKVRDGIEDQDAAAAAQMAEFSTGHFRAKGAEESSLSLEMNLPVHKPGVSGYPEAPKPQPKRQEEEPTPQARRQEEEPTPQARRQEEEPDDRTHVEVLPFGERVHQEGIASELFDVTGHSTTSARPLDPSKWDPKLQARPPPPARPAPVAMPRPQPQAGARPKAPASGKSKAKLIAAVAVLAAAVAAVAYFLLE